MKEKLKKNGYEIVDIFFCLFLNLNVKLEVIDISIVYLYDYFISIICKN